MAQSAKKATAKRSTAKTAQKKPTGRKSTSTRSGSAAPTKTAAAVPAAAAAPAKALSSWADLEHAFEQLLQRRFSHFLHWPQTPWNEISELMDLRTPSVDVVDRKKEVVVRVEVPGIKREDLDVSVLDRTLTIRGSSRQEKTAEKDNYFRREIRSGKLSRSVVLPADVNAAKAKSSFKDGVLELHLPKVRASKRHKISVA